MGSEPLNGDRETRALSHGPMWTQRSRKSGPHPTRPSVLDIQPQNHEECLVFKPPSLGLPSKPEMTNTLLTPACPLLKVYYPPLSGLPASSSAWSGFSSVHWPWRGGWSMLSIPSPLVLKSKSPPCDPQALIREDLHSLLAATLIACFWTNLDPPEVGDEKC